MTTLLLDKETPIIERETSPDDSRTVHTLMEALRPRIETVITERIVQFYDRLVADGQLVPVEHVGPVVD